MKFQRNLAIAAGILCAVAVLGGALKLPYGFYTLLRCVVSGVAIYLLVSCRERMVEGQKFGLIIAAIVFNPVLPVGLGRNLWKLVDLGTAFFYIWVAQTLLRAGNDGNGNSGDIEN